MFGVGGVCADLEVAEMGGSEWDKWYRGGMVCVVVMCVRR